MKLLIIVVEYIEVLDAKSSAAAGGDGAENIIALINRAQTEISCTGR